jgi:hypothetical protein
MERENTVKELRDVPIEELLPLVHQEPFTSEKGYRV